MLELGKHKKKLHKEVGKYAKEKALKLLLDMENWQKKWLKDMEKEVSSSKMKGFKELLKENITKDVILIKGLGMKMERFKNV